MFNFQVPCSFLFLADCFPGSCVFESVRITLSKISKVLLSIFLSVFVVIGNTPLIRLANFHLQRGGFGNGEIGKIHCSGWQKRGRGGRGVDHCVRKEMWVWVVLFPCSLAWILYLLLWYIMNKRSAEEVHFCFIFKEVSGKTED